MLLENAALGIVQLIVAIVFAVVALYIGFAVLGKITSDIDEENELAKGNTAIGIIVAAVFVAIALVVESGVSGLSAGISRALAVGLFSADGVITIGLSIFQLLAGIVLAVASIYLALILLDKLTTGIEEFEELKKGNVAVALEMGGIIIAVAWIIQSGVIGITATLV